MKLKKFNCCTTFDILSLINSQIKNSINFKINCLETDNKLFLIYALKEKLYT